MASNCADPSEFGAHVNVLIDEQIRRYDHLRSYTDGHDASHVDHGFHDGHGARDSQAEGLTERCVLQ